MVQRVDELSTPNSILGFDWGGTREKRGTHALTQISLEIWSIYKIFPKGIINAWYYNSIILLYQNNLIQHTYDVIIEYLEQSKRVLSVNRLKHNIIASVNDLNVLKKGLQQFNSQAGLSSYKIDRNGKSYYIGKPKGSFTNSFWIRVFNENLKIQYITI